VNLKQKEDKEEGGQGRSELICLRFGGALRSAEECSLNRQLGSPRGDHRRVCTGVTNANSKLKVFDTRG